MADLEKMRPRFPWSTPPSTESPEIAPLTDDQVRHLRLSWLSRFSVETLPAHLRANPGLALWVPSTGEYILAEQWRRRTEIAYIVEVHARKGKQALVEAIMAKARDLGHEMVLLSDDVWNENPKLYTNLKFAPIERIVFFQKDLRNFKSEGALEGLPTITVAPCGWAELDLLLELDHDSFPWLWWNSRAEFDEYRRLPGVAITIARLEDVPIGYASYTMYGGWAHLDRLAVISGYQGRRLGAAQLVHALGAMHDLGAASVGLSTQQSNTKSHALYKRYGFRQTREHMNFFGASLAAHSTRTGSG